MRVYAHAGVCVCVCDVCASMRIGCIVMLLEDQIPSSSAYVPFDRTFLDYRRAPLPKNSKQAHAYVLSFFLSRC